MTIFDIICPGGEIWMSVLYLPMAEGIVAREADRNWIATGGPLTIVERQQA